LPDWPVQHINKVEFVINLESAKALGPNDSVPATLQPDTWPLDRFTERPARAMTDAAETTARKQRGRPFRPGQSGNPAGRPAGKPNRATALLDAIGDVDLQEIVGKIVEKAKGGDLAAAKMILDRVAPPAKSRIVEIGLAEVGRHDGNEAILASFCEIVRAVAGGQISPAEALDLAELLDRQRQAFDDIAPARLKPKPTSEEAERERRSTEASLRLTDRLINALGS
jgi:Family of unknown function (DUF5681)